MLEAIRFEAFYGAMLAKYPSKAPEDVRESARKAWGDADKRKAIEETPKLRNVLDAAVDAYRRGVLLEVAGGKDPSPEAREEMPEVVTAALAMREMHALASDLKLCHQAVFAGQPITNVAPIARTIRERAERIERASK